MVWNIGPLGLSIPSAFFWTMWDPWTDEWSSSQLDDPPMRVTGPPSDSDSNDGVPPPTAFTGVSRRLATTMTCRQVAESLFGESILAPGLCRWQMPQFVWRNFTCRYHFGQHRASKTSTNFDNAGRHQQQLRD